MIMVISKIIDLSRFLIGIKFGLVMRLLKMKISGQRLAVKVRFIMVTITHQLMVVNSKPLRQ